ncbi:hypothetical protein ABH927_003792 [Planotetraspora sp. GP83]
MPPDAFSVSGMSQGLYLIRRPHVDFGHVVSAQCRRAF